MAAIGSSQVTTLYPDTFGAQRCCLLRITGVTSGDTIDVSSVGAYGFHKVQQATAIARGSQSIVVATAVGTVITLTLALMSLETVELLVLGE